VEVLQQVPTFMWNTGGIVGLFSLLFLALVKGWLVVGNVHREQLDDKDTQIANLTTTLEVRDAQMEKLTVVGETTIRILDSVERLARRKS
jgi:hypothetical protein